VFGAVAAVECFILEIPLIFDLIEHARDELGGPVGEAGRIGLVGVAAPGTVNIIIHSLEVLGDLAGVHATPADSIFPERQRRGNRRLRTPVEQSNGAHEGTAQQVPKEARPSIVHLLDRRYTILFLYYIVYCIYSRDYLTMRRTTTRVARLS
jgi:hypothetical protein